MANKAQLPAVTWRQETLSGSILGRQGQYPHNLHSSATIQQCTLPTHQFKQKKHRTRGIHAILAIHSPKAQLFQGRHGRPQLEIECLRPGYYYTAKFASRIRASSNSSKIRNLIASRKTHTKRRVCLACTQRYYIYLNRWASLLWKRIVLRTLNG